MIAIKTYNLKCVMVADGTFRDGVGRAGGRGEVAELDADRGRLFGPRRSGARSTWLQEQLDNDTLMLTDQVNEAAAKKALAYICESQVGGSFNGVPYARLATFYHSQADYIGTCLTLSLDTNGDGFPDVSIDCSCTDPMYS